MEKLMKGDIIVIDFPFSNLESSKRRPAYIAAIKQDLILCQITSKPKTDSILISKEDFLVGKLNKPSYLRPEKIFTLSNKKVLYKIGRLKQEKIIKIKNTITNIFLL